MKEISGDVRLTRWQQLWYLFFNGVRGVWGYRTLLKTHFWHTTFARNGSTDTPGRRYIDAFLRQEIPRLVPQKNIAMLDIGCGTGYVRDMLEGMGYSGTYVGIDVFREPKFTEHSDAFTVTFLQQEIEETHLEQTFDLVLSNTSFEHIQDDVTAAKKATEFAGAHGVQVHIIPGFWSLALYLWHGYRQYTPYRLKKVFGTDATFFRFGGAASYVLYLFTILFPERFVGTGKFRKTKAYQRLLHAANRVDRYLPFMTQFYAVVIKPNRN